MAHASHDGFSLLELVISVSIILTITLVGSAGFQSIADNGRQAAVERAAHDVFTASVAAQSMSSTLSISEKLSAIEVQYNETASDDITVEAAQDGSDITVTARGWDNRFTAVRSTAVAVHVPDRVKPEDVSKELVEEDDELVWEWTENDYADGIFRFTTSKTDSALNLGGLTEGTTITHSGTDETWELREGMNALPYSGTYTVHGGFRNIGPEVSFVNQDEWKDQYPKYSMELGMRQMRQLVASPFERGTSSVEVWENTGTVDISYAFAMSENLSHVATPPDTVTNMEGVFFASYNFNQDIGSWDVSRVTNMMNMFENAQKFDQDLNDWDVSNVEHYEGFSSFSPLHGSDNLPNFGS